MPTIIPENETWKSALVPGLPKSYWVKSIEINEIIKVIILTFHNLNSFNCFSERIDNHERISETEDESPLEFDISENFESLTMTFTGDLSSSLEFIHGYKAISTITYEKGLVFVKKLFLDHVSNDDRTSNKPNKTDTSLLSEHKENESYISTNTNSQSTSFVSLTNRSCLFGSEFQPAAISDTSRENKHKPF